MENNMLRTAITTIAIICLSSSVFAEDKPGEQPWEGPWCIDKIKVFGYWPDDPGSEHVVATKRVLRITFQNKEYRDILEYPDEGGAYGGWMNKPPSFESQEKIAIAAFTSKKKVYIQRAKYYNWSYSIEMTSRGGCR